MFAPKYMLSTHWYNKHWLKDYCLLRTAVDAELQSWESLGWPCCPQEPGTLVRGADVWIVNSVTLELGGGQVLVRTHALEGPCSSAWLGHLKVFHDNFERPLLLQTHPKLGPERGWLAEAGTCMHTLSPPGCLDQSMMDGFTGPSWWFQHSLEERAGDNPRQPDRWGWGGQRTRARQDYENISEEGFKCHFSPLGKPYFPSRTAVYGQTETLHSLFNGPFSPNLFL